MKESLAVCSVCQTPQSDGECVHAQGADRQRRKKLKSAGVVGVTCCSAGLPVLEGQSFDVVLLDEASQMVEPLSLHPLTTAKPRSSLQPLSLHHWPEVSST